MDLSKRLAVSLERGVIALALTFVLIFGVGIAMDMALSPKDAQAGLGPFVLAVFVAPAIGALTFVITLIRLGRLVRFPPQLVTFVPSWARARSGPAGYDPIADIE